ncbi:predicted protein [Naegleria gruberi]|uniref:Predicted protein n=1 Tax=Naegleria gruberi TaxID=5762 RepID=D2VSD0_NAEGR|nr:uncharacterized protein NAEGRDRAFT_71897 [Naegleria gruberi]EFC40324.1 predicted protein [Naegleria gruberi]|eukprot:XP_002673068.1 predicted protein [Naegleria gruberi strain NEG-M]
MSRYSTQPTMQRGASSNKVEDFEDMLDMDPYDLDENVKSLLVAEKLEEQYQHSFQNIAQMRQAIEEEDRKREKVVQRQKEPEPEKYYDSEGDDELEIMESDDHVTNQLEFTLDDIPFPANQDNIPIHERLLNFGSSLSLKHQLMKKAKDEKESETQTPHITEFAKQMKRKGAIENRLLQSRDELNARLDELRMEKEKKELEELRGPKINKRSKELKRDEPAYDRLLGYREQTLAKREMIKNLLEEKKQQEITMKPQINKKSQKLRRDIDAIQQWEKEKNLKTEQLRNEIKKQEIEQLQQPKINPISEKLAAQMDRGQDVGDYLIQRYEKKKMEREIRNKIEKEKETKEAKPHISVHSANLERQGVVFDRLYIDSLEKENKRREMLEQIENKINNNIDPQTGTPLYNPIINARSALMARREPVEDVLLKKREEAERKKMALADREKKELEAQGGKVGAYSRLLVEILEKRTNTNTMDRLTRVPKKPEPTVITQTYSFKPAINQNSREIDKYRNQGTPRQEVLLRKGYEYEQHKKEIEQRIKEVEMSHSPKKKPKTPNGHSLADRSLDWAKRKDLKLESERKMREAKESEECTFKPNVKRLDVSNIAPCESHFRTKEEENSYLIAMKKQESVKKLNNSKTEDIKPKGGYSQNKKDPVPKSIRPKSRGSVDLRTSTKSVNPISNQHPINTDIDRRTQNTRYDEMEDSEIMDNENIYDEEEVDPEMEFEQLRRLVQHDKSTTQGYSNNFKNSPPLNISDLLDSEKTMNELYRLSNELDYDDMNRMTPEAYDLITNMIRNSRK